jgi:hypothetical protein
MADKLKPCIYHPIKDIDCPIFRLDHILNAAEKNRTERELILHAGGVIRVKLDWDCNLDRNIKLCKPKYSFARLDTPFHEETFSPGFNFRFASHWKYGENHLRSLKKAYGLRLIISVSGKAGKFDFITLTLNTGSLVGIFGLATFVCDIILLNLTKKASIYRDHVFQRVDSDFVRRNSALSSSRGQSKSGGRIFENRKSNDQTIPQPFSTRKSLERFSDLSYSPNSNRILPNVGFTNTAK